MKHLPSGLLEEIVERLVKGLSPEKIILFGSYAYGEPTEDSDIDILVIIPDSAEPRYRRAQKACSFLWGLAIPTEVVVLTQREVERSSTVIASLAYQALHRGKVLYG
jgi:predicted nucleotidyltransferase